MWHIFPFRDVLSCRKRTVILVLFMDVVPCGTVPPDSRSVSVITDKLIVSSNPDVIFPACYTLLSGIKSINLKDLLRSLEIFMWIQMSPHGIVRWIKVFSCHFSVLYFHDLVRSGSDLVIVLSLSFLNLCSVLLFVCVR